MKKLKLKQPLIGLALSGVFIAASGTAGATEIKPNAYYPGKEIFIPGVENDPLDTYRYWKDRDTIRKSIADGVPDEKMNYKNIRWLEADDFNGEVVIAEAELIFNRVGPKGESCASCHGERGEKLSGVATTYPKYDSDAGRMVAMVNRVEMCAEKNTGENIPVDSAENTLLVNYINHKSHGQKIQVDVDSKHGKEAFERGRNLFFKRVGQFDFACASCHTAPTALKQLRGMRPSTIYGDAASYPIWEYPASPERRYLYTIQRQISSCSFNARMELEDEGSPEYIDMEVFIRALSNGHEINSQSTYYGEAL